MAKSKPQFFGVLFALLLAACGGSGSGGSSGVSLPTPVAGQWSAAFGVTNTNNLGLSFAIPSASAGVHYVYTTPPSNLASAKTYSLNYSLTGNATLTPSPCTASAGCQDIPPASMTLFLWEKGDDLTCSQSGANTQYYRLFAPGSKINLNYGTNLTVSAPLSASSWQGCYPGAVPANYWAQLMANPFAIGFTFSGQYFDGHGIYAQTGSAEFVINKITVQ